MSQILPKRTKSHELEDKSILAFENALNTDLFIIQGRDEHDYGTDLQIELIDNGNMTNFRTHVQLKSTEASMNKDGSVSVAVEIANINYLSRQKLSMYACYHQPSSKLLVCFVEDVISQYEHKNSNWREQKTATVNFLQRFDQKFQNELHRKLLIFSNKEYLARLEWNVTPVNAIDVINNKNIKNIQVPHNQKKAEELLKALYFSSDNDLTISHYFEEFEAVLGDKNISMQYAYMAEVNLGVNGVSVNLARIKKAIDVFKKELSIKEKRFSPGSMRYCIGNAWLTCQDFPKAIKAYLKALPLLENDYECTQKPQDRNLLAMCHKNLASAFKGTGEIKKTIAHNRLALSYNPYLSEAHFALGIDLYLQEKKYDEALDHFDLTNFSIEAQNISLRGWRIPLLFKTHDERGAYREINSILGYADKEDWIFPWCAKHINDYGIDSVEGARKSTLFWLRYHEFYPDDIRARKAYLLCQWYLNEHREKTDIDYVSFKNEITTIIKNNDDNSAFLWDRIGHWAQIDDNWEEAEKYYRYAYELEPKGHYGYCLGTALNHLKRYAEALPILLEQAEKYQPDAMSWFQVAVACNEEDQQEKRIAAYEKAIELNPNYEHAWFNLCGTYLNLGKLDEAITIFSHIIMQYPDHELTAKLYDGLCIVSNMKEPPPLTV